MATNFFFEAGKLLRQHNPSSFATKSERFKTIKLVDKQLVALGFKGLELNNLKPKHIEALVTHWQAEGLALGTIKNRMAHLRWLAEKIGKNGLVPRSNDSVGISRRVYVTNENKSRKLSDMRLNLITDQYVQMSLRLQAAFGLRREEAMKIQPAKAYRGDRLVLDASWCKGGRDRAIPILTAAQHELLAEAKALAAGRSLIPKELSYVQQMKRYENTCIKIGLDRAHGLRHSYAHRRYMELTGFECPAVSGVSVCSLPAAQQAADRYARNVITGELGHSRLQVTAVYLGR
ncbi:integrase [Shewanella sp. Sh95]|uniref:phage integrase N-terminal domain-containing protein n=1 Tax=Shewanella TaxID=22 RepID=UPI0006D9B421|nr:phage integrase N-terminal domain-containing protein [Shewanella sp. Sh95]KPN78943.1 integrase [Shewanella sp. Sh95]